ncbi:hypothetical protein ACUHMQ_19940 [Chitinimonas sp. PSY-7]|uniref:hypothetical protein n=1 Tax=Chitinimonas sp. PSY-7 TaxID=3459088 RepID=UPI0040403B06
MSAVTPALPTYIPSGRVSLRVLPWLFLLGIPGTAINGWGYAVTLEQKPPFWVAPFLMLIFILCCNLVNSTVFEKGHSRSVRFNTIIAALLCVFAFWVRWVATFKAIDNASATEFATSGPITWASMLWTLATTDAANDPNQFGPIVRCIIWLLEFAAAMLFCQIIARASTRTPYSEAIRAWAKSGTKGELYWEGGNVEDLAKHLEQNGAAALLAMQKANELQANIVASTWWTIALEGLQVEPDPAARWLKLEHVEQRRNDKGGISTKRHTLVEAWQISDAEYKAIFIHLGISLVPLAANKPVQDENAERPTPVELQTALAAYQAGNPSSAITVATAHCQHPDPAVQADALRLCALSHCDMAQWDQAFAKFHSLFPLEQTAHNALQLATTSVMSGELLRGQAWLDKAIELNTKTHEVPVVTLRTGYISALEKSGNLEAALPHLNWVADVYRSLVNTDAQFLWTRGLPLFSTFLDKSLPILRASLSDAEITAWYNQVRDDVDPAGKDALDQHLQKLHSD